MKLVKQNYFKAVWGLQCLRSQLTLFLLGIISEYKIFVHTEQHKLERLLQGTQHINKHNWND